MSDFEMLYDGNGQCLRVLRKDIKEKRAPNGSLGSGVGGLTTTFVFLALEGDFLRILSRDQHMVGAVLHYSDYEYATLQSQFYIFNLDFYFIIPNNLAKLQ